MRPKPDRKEPSFMRFALLLLVIFVVGWLTIYILGNIYISTHPQ